MGRIGRYDIVRPLGAGGMGEVFLAHDGQLGRAVAVKCLDAEHATGQRALKEARTIARLSHPNIAQLFDVVEHDGVLHLVMEFVAGETLAAAIRSGPLPEERVRDIGRQVADALDFAHQHGVVHCDIKPANVIVGPDGRAKVLDFGIAHIEGTTNTGGATTTGVTVRGTPAYTAPEVLLGEAPTPRSDIFSLGVTLFEALAARRPFEGRQAAGLLEPATPPPSVRDFVPGVSPALSDIVGRAIAPSPAARPSSAAALRSALESAELPATTRRAWPWVAAVAGVAIVGATVALRIPRDVRPEVSSSTRPAVLGVIVSNATGDRNNDYLGAGIAETLVSQLAGTKGVTVVSTAAAAEFRGRPNAASDAIKALGLTHVVAGTLQRTDNALRVNFTMTGPGNRLTWGTVLDGTVSDLLGLQQRASDAVLAAVRGTGLSSNTSAPRAPPRPTANEEAFEQYSYGRAMLSRADVPGSLDRAVRFFERAIELDPGFVWARAALGEAAWRQYRATRDDAWIARARLALDAAVAHAPDDATVRFALAVLEQGTGRATDALENLHLVLARQPTHLAAYRLRAQILAARGDVDGAVADLREAANLHPDDPATARALGLVYFDAGRLDEAVGAFTRLTALQPDNASAFQMLGTAHHAAGELDRALVAYDRANAITPRATAYSNIGTIHTARGDFATAVDSYRKAIELQPKEAATRRNLAEALDALGRSSDARAEYATSRDLAQQAVAVNSSDARAHALVALCEARLGRHIEARRALSQALRLGSSDNEVVYKAALVEVAIGDDSQAAKWLRRAVELGYSKSLILADQALVRLHARPDLRGLFGGTPNVARSMR